ncbi:hypothetical protein F4801DRAFT_432091 [Xylaria longipes]|nr:hypothetical protein F4801DRAFT_432091 [Xylaria longipes]
MSSAGDPNRPFGEGDNDDAPTHNRPWPFVDSFLQGRFERQYLADGDTIDFDSVPKLQFWARWFAVSDAFRMLSVLKRVAKHSTSAQRPLTGVEATAISQHHVHSIRTFAWSQPLCWAFAAAAAFAGRRTFRFPFYQPKMKKFDPYCFPTKRMPLLRGARVAAIWHATRLCAYSAVCWFPTAILFTSIAENSFAAHTTRDSRLAPLIEDIRRNAKRGVVERQSRRRAGTPNPAGTGSAQNTQQTGDGAYQGGQTPQEYGTPDYSTQSSTPVERSSSATESSRTAYPSWPRSTSTQPAPYRTQESTSPGLGSRREDDDSGLFDDDDASPVATSARRREVPSSSSVSSWDRIRQQARPGSPNWEKGDSSGQEQGWAQLRQDKTRNPRDYNPKADSYSYSTDDEEREKRNYEKEQAQKEFDALLEAERRGDGSSGGSSSSRGWRR